MASLAFAASAGALSFTRTDYTLGTWTNSSPTTWQVGYSLNDTPVVLTDMNGDGKLDIVVSHVNRNAISVLLNNGNGTFTPASGSPFVPTGSGCPGPDSILAGDFNNDGKQDLLVECTGATKIVLLPGNGSGGLGPAQDVVSNPAAGGPMMVANIDGSPDLVYNYVVGATCWVPMSAFSNPLPLDSYAACGQNGASQWGTVAHWYTAQCGGDELPVFTWNGSNPDYSLTILALGYDMSMPPHCNTFATNNPGIDTGISHSADAPSGIVAADLENTGFPDVVMSSQTGFHTVSGWNGTNYVTTTNFSTSNAVLALRVTDFDGDGHLDLAGVEENYSTMNLNQVEIRLGQGSATQFGAPQTFTVFGDQQNYSDSPKLAVGDLNGDGKPDIVTVASGGNNGISSTVWSEDATVLLSGTGSTTGSGGGSGGSGGSGGTTAGSGGTTTGGSTSTSTVGGSPSAGTSLAPFLGVLLRSVTVNVINGTVKLSIPCPPGSLAFCAGSDTRKSLKAIAVRVVRKKKRILTFGSARFSIPAGRTGTVTIKLSSAARKLLAKSHTLKVLEVVVAHDQRGGSKTTSTTITLKLAKKKKRG